MEIWVVRAGKEGQDEQYCIENGKVVIGWDDVGDLSLFANQSGIAGKLRELFPDKTTRQIANWTGQLWAFSKLISIGDIVCLPMKTSSVVLIGRFTGTYVFDPDAPDGCHHFRTVDWISNSSQRSAFSDEALYSLNVQKTIFKIQSAPAKHAVNSILLTISAFRDVILPPLQYEEESINAEEDIDDYSVDLKDQARDQIARYITENFREHELTRLIDSILIAKGYATFRSPPGPDGGVDILAGLDPFGFGQPKLCVEVKSGKAPVDVQVFRQFMYVLEKFKASQGIIASLHGFNKAVKAESKQEYFRVRLWDINDIIQQIEDVYDLLPGDLKSKLPLERSWILINTEEE